MSSCPITQSHDMWLYASSATDITPDCQIPYGTPSQDSIYLRVSVDISPSKHPLLAGISGHPACSCAVGSCGVPVSSGSIGTVCTNPKCLAINFGSDEGPPPSLGRWSELPLCKIGRLLPSRVRDRPTRNTDRSSAQTVIGNTEQVSPEMWCCPPSG